MKVLQNVLGRLAYLIFTVLMTTLGVGAWLFSSLRDRAATTPTTAKRPAKPAPQPAAPPRERVPK